ncbi:hypothetical protein Btru_033050 [Bulinus truncatus]|nr:hypothetical protein Btru_033050 [Bulinus truncatus]
MGLSRTMTNGKGNLLMSDELFWYFDTYVNLWTLLLLSCFGVVTNSLNAAVFIRQGFKDSVNVSMMVITCWDLVKCTTGLIHRLYGPIHAVSPLVSYLWLTFTYYLDYTPIFAGYVNYALTAYVSVERCLCVSRPFTVKSIITRRVTLVMVIAISVVIFGAYFVIYFIYEIVYVSFPEFNMSLPVFTYNEFYFRHKDQLMPYYKTVAIILPFISFLILCSCSSITLYYIQASAKFRKDKNTQTLSSREQKVSKMLLTIIAVKIANLFPRMISYSAQLVQPEFYVLGAYHNVFMTVARFMYVLDFLNAGVTFFIYLNMSTNFRSTFYEIFPALAEVKQ